jgi:pentatricopeptide repeat protein
MCFTRDTSRVTHHTSHAGVKPDVITFSSMIDACAKAQNASEGLRIFRLMQEKNVAFDYIVCATMITLCCKAQWYLTPKFTTAKLL